MSSYQIDLSPSLDPSVGHSDQHQRRSHSIATARSNITRPWKEVWSPACSRRAPRSSASTTAGAATARPERTRRRPRGPGLGEKSASGRRLCRTRSDLARLRWRAHEIGGSARHRMPCAVAAQRAECGLRIGGALALGVGGQVPAGRPAPTSRSGAPHGAGRPPRDLLFVERLQGHQCRRDGGTRVVLCRYFSWIAGGRPKLGGIRPDRRISRASAGLSDRGSRNDFAVTLEATRL